MRESKTLRLKIGPSKGVFRDSQHIQYPEYGSESGMPIRVRACARAYKGMVTTSLEKSWESLLLCVGVPVPIPIIADPVRILTGLTLIISSERLWGLW